MGQPEEFSDLTRPSPPEAGRVAQRALIQSAIVCRGSIELYADHPSAAETHDRLNAWLDHLDLTAAMEPVEAVILGTPRGAMSPQQVISATWAAEGLAILAWAIRRSELPSHDAKVDPFALTDSLGFLDIDAGSLIDQSELRPLEELQTCREFFYAVHCRYGQLRHQAVGIGFMNWIETGWLPALGIDPSSFLVNGDLGVCGKSIGEADKDLVRTGEWITQRRHQASIWLVGEYPLFSETPADI